MKGIEEVHKALLHSLFIFRKNTFNMVWQSWKGGGDFEKAVAHVHHVLPNP